MNVAYVVFVIEGSTNVKGDYVATTTDTGTPYGFMLCMNSVCSVFFVVEL